MMNGADYAILAIIGISTLLSLLRGMVKEVLSLAAWVAAFFVARTFNGTAAAFLATHGVSVPSVQWVLGFGLLFVATLFGMGIVNFLVSKLVQATGLTATDRVLGMVFGMARGAAVVTLLVLVLTTLPVTRDPWWQQSTLIPHFRTLAIWLKGEIPPDVAKYLNFLPAEH